MQEFFVFTEQEEHPEGFFFFINSRAFPSFSARAGRKKEAREWHGKRSNIDEYLSLTAFRTMCKGFLPEYNRNVVHVVLVVLASWLLPLRLRKFQVQCSPHIFVEGEHEEDCERETTGV